MKLRFSQVYAILTAIALCYLAVTGYAAEVTPGDAYGEPLGGIQWCPDQDWNLGPSARETGDRQG